MRGEWPREKKTDGSERCSLPARSGESVKGGGSPFHKKKGSMHRNSPPRAIRRAREFRCPARSAGRSGRGACLPEVWQLDVIPAECPPSEPLRFPTGKAGQVRGEWPREKKTDGSERCSLPARSGESVKGGGSPFHKKKGSMHRNSPPRAIRRAREFRCPARSAGRSGRGACLPEAWQLDVIPAECPPSEPLRFGRGS